MKIDLKNNQLILSFQYDIETIKFVKEFDDRHWDPKRRVWKIPASIENYNKIFTDFTKSVECSNSVLNWVNKVTDIQRQIKHAKKFQTVKLPLDYNFKTIPFNHQIKCFNFFKELTMGGLFLEMGLGKTKIIIDLLTYFKLMGKIRNPVLYVCPNSVLENVKNEFEMHSSLDWNICILQGTKGKKIKLLSQSEYNIFIINYEAVRTIEQELMKKGLDAIICDESTRIKNSRALCSKSLHRLGQAVKYRYIMTGTPITQCVIDIYSQYKFLEPSLFGPSFYAFKNKYAIMGGFNNHQITGYRHLDELHKKIFDIAIRCTKKECLDLPDKVYEVKQFDLNKEEREIYDKIKENILVSIYDQQITAQLAITKLIKLTQITSGFVLADDHKVIAIKNSSKLKLLKETLEDIFPSKVIIWNNYIANIDMVSKLLCSMHISHVTFDGRTPQNERQALVDKFQNDPDCKVFVGQIRTGGLGLNLTAASYVIYFTNTYSLADRLQSEDRAHRIGQVNKVTYIDLVARKTIEKSILSILKSKLNLAQLVIDNQSLEDLADGKY